MSGRRVMRRLRWWAVTAVCATGVAAAALHLSVADGSTVVTAGEDVVPIVPPAPASPGPAPAPAPVPRSSWAHDAGLGADHDLPDPGAIHADGELHVYGTSGSGAWVPHFAGPSPAEPGTDRGDALPGRPAWVAADDRTIWAPAVARIGDRYVMAFAATAGPRSGSGAASGSGHAGLKCVGTALAASPAGPFVAQPEPLRCARHHWAIDPYFVGSGDRWSLLWREDHPDHPTGRIVGARLAADGMSLAGDPRTLLVGEHPWEDGYPGEGPRALASVARAPGLGLHGRAGTTDPAGVGPVENPAMARHPATGEWLLTWSANRWETPDYATGLAVCESPLGPCERVSREAPWLRTSASDAVAGTTARFVGAGGLGFVTGPDGHLYAVFHAYPVAPGAPSVADDPGARWPTAPRAPWTYRVDATPTRTYTLTDPT